MIEEFTISLQSISFVSSCNNKVNSELVGGQEQRLKQISERWSQGTNKRNKGKYTHAPDESTFTQLKACLIASKVDMNLKLKLPKISPDWINLAIEVLFSTQYYGIL